MQSHKYFRLDVLHHEIMKLRGECERLRNSAERYKWQEDDLVADALEKAICHIVDEMKKDGYMFLPDVSDSEPFMDEEMLLDCLYA